MTKLKQAVDKIQKEIQKNIYGINAGGCGWFAYYMAISLEKLGINASIKLITDEEGAVYEKKVVLNKFMNNEPCREGDLRRTSFAHCYIKVGEMHFDGKWGSINQIKNYFDTEIFEGEYSIKEMETALAVAGWNPSYNTDNNQLLKDIIQGNLMKYYMPIISDREDITALNFR